ncbi:MAG: hypothetical protein IPK97_12460 [Ahniella sp.]|nr:hypothetical protein [Ahniella sp.]
MRIVREPMFWLVLAFPIATIVAGILTIRLASSDGPLDAAPESVQRRAQVQTTDLGPDQRAAELGLTATLLRQEDGHWAWTEWPRLEGAVPSLSVLHPNRANQDVHFPKVSPGEILTLQSDQLPLALCEFRLEDMAQGWRLVGRFDEASGQVRFHSKLAP